MVVGTRSLPGERNRCPAGQTGSEGVHALYLVDATGGVNELS